MPKLYKNEYYRDGEWRYYSLEDKPVYAIIMGEFSELIKELSNLEQSIKLEPVSKVGNSLYAIRATPIESYYYLHNDVDHWHTFYMNGNFVFRSSVDGVVEKMQWIATQAPLTYEMEEMILKVMGQGACKRHEIVELIYWHLRALNRLRLGDDSR
jgi:hypothetical protein